MGAEDSLQKLKKKKNTKKSKEGNTIFLQKEVKLAKAMEDKKKKKKRAHVLIRCSRDELHLSNYKDNVDGGQKENKSTKKKKRKNVRLDETESLEIDQSNEREDALGQENNVSAEKRKSRKKKRRTEKKVQRNESIDHYVEANDDPDQKSEKDHSLSITRDNLMEKKGQAGDEEIGELSSGDEDCLKGMRKWVLDYYQSRPGLKVLQERIDEFITSYEAKKEQERKEKEALAVEDGWTVVVHHKGRKKTTDSETGIAVGSVSQAAVIDNMDKKKKKDVGLDFYQFQKREAKRNGSQLPIKRTGPSNFVIWKAQVEFLMLGHDLYGYLDGTMTVPSKTVLENSSEVPNPKYKIWFRQDQLIRNALMASVDQTITSAITKTSNSKQAWDTCMPTNHTLEFSVFEIPWPQLPKILAV